MFKAKKLKWSRICLTGQVLCTVLLMAASRPTALRIRPRVRTEFVVSKIFCHLLEDSRYQEQEVEIPSENSTEVEVLGALKQVVSDFKTDYSDRMVDMCSEIEISSETANNVFLGIVNELFSEGITWAMIATLFVFTSELAAHCLRKELPETVVDDILDCCLKFVQDKLEIWIQDHGGWEGIVTFSRGNQNADAQEPNNATSPGWATTVLHGTIRLFGTLAHIANSTGQIMSIPFHNVRN